MSKRYVQVPISYLEPIFLEWMQAFEKGHFLNVFFMPYGDLLFRAMQFSDWMSEKQGKEVKLINFETELIANPENLEEKLDKYKNERLILIAKHTFMRPDAPSMGGVLERWYGNNGKGMLIFHEGFPEEMFNFVKNQIVWQNQLVHKIYPASVSFEYAVATAKLFGVSVDSQKLHKIVDYCGGIPWLVNDVLRRVNEEQLFENEIFLWKVEQIVASIPSIPSIEKDLVRFGLKSELGRWIPVLRDYFEKAAKKTLQISSNEIFLRGKDLTRFFSLGELRILEYLNHSSGIVKREVLGGLFWQENNDKQYSDWAFDAIMSRLRKKVMKLGVPIAIKTRRGKGYELS